MSTAVAKTKAERLKEVERTIERGMKTFWEMGEAFREARDEKLYEEAGFKSFKDYCRDRWDLHHNTVYQTIKATDARKAIAAVSTRTRTPPPNGVAHARSLATLDTPEEQAEVWKRAVDKRKAKDGKMPSHYEVIEEVKEHKRKKSTPRTQLTAEERAASEAMDAASELRRRAEAFVAAVENVLERKDDLPEHEAQSAAYTIVSTLHSVTVLMEEAGVIQRSVASGVLSGLDDFDDQEASVVVG